MSKLLKISLISSLALIFLMLGLYFIMDSNTSDALKENSLVEINSEELSEVINNEDTMMLYVYADYCQYCSEFSPRLDEVLKHNETEAYKIASDKDDNQYKYLEGLLGDKFHGIPALYVLSNGEIKEYFIGSHDNKVIQNLVSYYIQLKESESSL